MPRLLSNLSDKVIFSVGISRRCSLDDYCGISIGMICSDVWQSNTTSNISKLFYITSQAVWRVKFGAILKYHECYLRQISRTIHAITCLYYNLNNSVI